MGSRCAIYVDAGYALAAAATRIAGTSLRGSVQADHARVIDALIAHAEDGSGLPLLRVHWYDAARDGVPDPSQQKIGLLPRVKLRLGRIGFDGEQKGVDLRIGLDLIASARNAAVEIIYLVSGDDDLAEAVEEAQAHGVQVVILAVPAKNGEPHGVSRHLQAAADGLELLDAAALDTAITPRLSLVANASAPEAAPSARHHPTPTMLAGRGSRPAAAGVSSPPAPTPPAPAAAELVFSSITGRGSVPAPGHEHDETIAEAIDQVVRRVLQTWLMGDTAKQRAECEASRPSIPRDVDRALLLDLANTSANYDLPDPIRHQLRARFWTVVDQRELPTRAT